MVIIDEMALFDLVVSHLDASAQLRQDHHLDILVLDINGLILLIHLLVAHCLDNRIRIYHATRTLINTFFQEHRVLLGLSYFVGRNSHDFSPSFYHLYIYNFTIYNLQFIWLFYQFFFQILQTLAFGFGAVAQQIDKGTHADAAINPERTATA